MFYREVIVPSLVFDSSAVNTLSLKSGNQTALPSLAAHATAQRYETSFNKLGNGRPVFPTTEWYARGAKTFDEHYTGTNRSRHQWTCNV